METKNMKTKKGMRAFYLLMILAFIGMIFFPAVSADDDNKSWPDTFEQWAGQRDMSKYNPDIKITPSKKIDEVNAKSYPGLILPSPKENLNFKSVDGEVSFLPDEKVVNIYNYDSSAASRQVIFWSVEDSYGYNKSFSNPASKADMTVNIPFKSLYNPLQLVQNLWLLK